MSIYIPSEIIAGDTLSWEVTLPEYPATDWVLKYNFVNKENRFEITANALEEKHVITVNADTSATYISGTYTCVAYIVWRGTGVTTRHTLGTATVTVKLSLSTAITAVDTRSHVKKVLDALEAVIEGRASRDVEQITIGGKSITKMPIKDLLKWHSKYKWMYEQELATEKLKMGISPRKKILTRFT